MNSNSEIIVKVMTEKLGPAELPAFRREMQDILRKYEPRIVLDLSGVKYLDSAGIDCLIHCLSAVVRNDGELKLAALSPYAAALLAMTRVDRFFEIFPSVPRALKSFDLACGVSILLDEHRMRRTARERFNSNSTGASA